MKPFIRSLLIIAALILIMVAILIPLLNRHSTDFEIKRPEKITRIVLHEGETSVILRKQDHRWQVNDTFPARKDAIRFLMHTLENMEVKSVLSGDVVKKILSDKGIRRIRVSCYRGAIPVRTFMYIPAEKGLTGNLVHRPRSRKYFTVYLPGEEEVSVFPFTTNLYYWRSHKVFDFLPGEVREVTLQHLQTPEKSFVAGVDSTDRYHFRLLQESFPAGYLPDTAKIARYLTYFQSLEFDEFAWQLSPEQRAEILSDTGKYLLKIVSADGDTVQIRTIPKKQSVPGRQDTTEAPDPDITWAWIKPPGELVILRYYRIDPWLKDPEYFLIPVL